MFYLTTHSIYFIYGYMASDIWLRTTLIVRKETRCRHIGYSFRLTTRIILYAPSHRQDSTYHDLCYTIVEHWLEREIAQWVHPMKDRSDNPSLLPQSYISLYRRRETAAWGPVYACLALAESLPDSGSHLYHTHGSFALIGRHKRRMIRS